MSGIDRVTSRPEPTLGPRASTSAPRRSRTPPPRRSPSTATRSTSPPVRRCCAPRPRPASTIPKLCATDSLKAFGSCRMCLVEVDGAQGRPRVVHDAVHRRHGRQHPDRAPSATCAATSWSSTSPTTPRTATAAPAATARCRRWPCTVGSAEVRYGRPGPRPRRPPGVRSTEQPLLRLRPSACIVCSRCVRACGDIQGTFALTVEGRGFDSRISAGGTDFMSSECVSCGACVQACPTSALQEKSVVAARHADPLGRDHLRLLRRGLLVPRRGPGRRRRRPGRADDPVARTAAPTRATAA